MFWLIKIIEVACRHKKSTQIFHQIIVILALKQPLPIDGQYCKSLRRLNFYIAQGSDNICQRIKSYLIDMLMNRCNQFQQKVNVHDAHFIVVRHDRVKKRDQVQVLRPGQHVFLYVVHHLLIIGLQ